MPRRPSTVIAVAAAVLVLAGCSSGGSGSAPTSSTETQPVKSFESATVAASGSAPGESTLESESASSVQTGVPIADFTKVSYAVPAGYVLAPANQYAPVIPLETAYQAYYLVPRNAKHGRDLLAIVLYTLPSDETVDSGTDQLGRVKAYNAKLDATVKGNIDHSDIAGISGYSESATQPPDYHYAAWFAFGAHHLLTLSCQIETKSELASIGAACGAALVSLTVS